MDWRLFLSTFFLILLAELGDKTQLTALAAAAGAKSPWVVFAAAASALVLAVGIAVLIGFYLQTLLPIQLIQIVAGVLFLAFGVAALWSAFNPSMGVLAASAQAELDSPKVERLGFFSKLSLKAAMQFEDSASHDYKRIASEASDPRFKELFLWLAQEDERHLEMMKELSQKSHALPKGEVPIVSVSRPIPDLAALQASEAAQRDLRLLKDSARHEASALAFYSSLAESMGRKSKMATLFRRLALEEKAHLERIQDVLLKVEKDFKSHSKA